MTIIHTADIHANKERYDELEKFFLKLINLCSQEKIDAVLISGDLTDHPLINSANSHLIDYVLLIKQLSSLTNVYLIYGTPSHEPAGCLKIFELVGAKVLGEYFPYFSIETLNNGEKVEFIALPEPRYSLLEGETITEKKQYYKNLLNDFKRNLPFKFNKRICMLHGEVEGATYQNNQDVDSCFFTLDYLRSLDCDYYACGHIHKPQQLKNLKGYYSGSPCPLDFGENYKGQFLKITF